MNSDRNLGKNAKIRIVVLLVLVIYSAYSTMASIEVMHIMNIVGDVTKAVEKGTFLMGMFNIFESFAEIADKAAGFLGGIRKFTTFVVYGGAIVSLGVVSLIASALMNVIGLKESEIIAPKEYRISRLIVIIGAVASVGIGTALSGVSCIKHLVIINAVWVAGVYFVYIRTLRTRCSNI